MNKGIIELSFNLINQPDAFALLREAWRDIVPLHGKPDFLRQTVEYICLSHHFEPVKEGESVPCYEIKMTKKKGKFHRTGIKKIGFKRWSFVDGKGKVIHQEGGGKVNQDTAIESRKANTAGKSSNLKVQK